MNNLDLLEEQAINAAVNHQWDLALRLNKEIIEADSENLGAHLRLGFAALQKNDLVQAKTSYKKILRLQPSNRIALENIEKVKILEEKGKRKKNCSNPILDPNLFLEVPGKTKTIKLVNLGQKEELAGLTIGQQVELKLKKRRIEVRTQNNEYIGCLPDDVSRRLQYFLQEKSSYSCYVKETSLNEVVVFIKEEIKGRKVQHYPSFPQNPQTFMSDIHHHEEQGERDDENEEEEWLSVGEEMAVEEKDEDLAHLQADEEEESDEE